MMTGVSMSVILLSNHNHNVLSIVLEDKALANISSYKTFNLIQLAPHKIPQVTNIIKFNFLKSLDHLT